MKHPYITVIGNIATGKSTLTSFLAESLHAHHGIADELYKINPFFQDAVVDRNRWSLASDLWFLLKRVEIIKEYNSILKTQPVVQDSGILMSWAYSNSRLNLKHMNKQETDLYNELFETLTQSLPQESLIIYLTLPIPELKKRIVERNRSFEVEHFTDEYLLNLESSLSTLVNKLPSHLPVFTIAQSNWYEIIDNPKEQKRLLRDLKKYISES